MKRPSGRRGIADLDRSWRRHVWPPDHVVPAVRRAADRARRPGPGRGLRRTCPRPVGVLRIGPAADIRIGAVFPLASNAGDLAKEELAGVQAAADFVNADGGVDGRRIVLDVQDLEPGADARGRDGRR